MAPPPHAAILLCAGRSSRMRGTVADKVLAPLAGRPALEYSLRAFAAAGVLAHWIFVTRDAAQQTAIARLLAKVAPDARPIFVLGGKERQNSVLHGLRAAPAGTKFVFIHDCARPLVSPANLRALLAAVKKDSAAVLAHRVTDTIKQAPAAGKAAPRRARLKDLRRETLWAMETPQVFDCALITRAYENVRRRRARVTDDAAAAALLKHPVTLVENSSPNPKLTHPPDMAWAELLIRATEA